MVRKRHSGSIAGRVIAGSAIGVGTIAAAGAIAVAVIAVVFARTVVTPPRKRDEDVIVVAHDDATITLSATVDSMTPGTYSFWFSGDSGHARIGEIVSYDTEKVTRQLLGVDFGDIAAAHRGRLSGWFYLSPADFPVPFEEVSVDTELGPAPAWLIPAEDPTDQWMIGVHGRAVRRQETLRAVPVFRDAGYTSLLVSYRNDGDAPRSADNRYALGDTEWRDVEAAIRYATEHGATSIVLMGWSMGGATVLQAVTRSDLAATVRGIVLESPVVDWFTALDYQGVAYRLPRPIRLVIFRLLASRWARLLTGQAAPIDLKRLDLVARAQELHAPILLLHSDDDGYVPATASRALAVARPDIVTYVPFATARHTKLWNYDADRWNGAIRSWLDRLV